ncbi:MAG TPA: hypothetical protein PKC55_10275 [Dysgonomonas sp.]|uniref:hypothetical protein n=1 Tax=unclassified Dysgonomonas TaxID=2630389 RepID=UPI0025BF8B05|nr:MULTISPECIES: hypothetical protein [unclassified Dysgonomonas]HML65205.1 hypothetical protein [Dysgonomonas sp.]
MRFFRFKSVIAISAIAMGIFTSCSDDDNNGGDPNPVDTNDFQLAFASGSGSISGTYMQGLADVNTGTISFENAGALLSTGRTSRIFPSTDGKYIYSLTYQQGTIDKWEYKGGSNYTKLATIDASVPLGSVGVRLYKLNDEIASVHYITATAQYATDGTSYIGHKMTVSIGFLDLATMQLKSGYRSNIDLQLPGTLGADGYYISRIDCPVLSNGKLYYGAAVSKFNATTAKSEETDRAMTFVIDYPSLTNATVIETTLASGSTNGYRTPTLQVNEAGEIYQMVSNGGNTGGTNGADAKVSIVKIKNGQYDTTYKYSLDELLGNPAASNGFFYVGNGIAYIPYEKKHLPQIQIGVNPQGQPSYSAPWGLARMDLINNTVVDLNVPDGLWLTQWQTSVVKNGKFYIALSPVGQAGHIYMFDVNSTSANGQLGAATVAGADQYFIGIY